MIIKIAKLPLKIEATAVLLRKSRMIVHQTMMMMYLSLAAEDSTQLLEALALPPPLEILPRKNHHLSNHSMS
jgi:hypothetical protein